MAEEKKITFMWIKVDLQCPSCRKKIKKVLCKFPQIQDQVYNEKENLVAIKVVCCCPEKVKQKIICKGGDTIKSIEIIKETEKKKPNPPDKEQKPQQKPVCVQPVPVRVPVLAYPVGFGTCCTECYEGRDGGPCYSGHGRPPPCYDGCYCGRPIYDSYGGGYSRSCYTYVSRCEETSPGCTIM